MIYKLTHPEYGLLYLSNLTKRDINLFKIKGWNLSKIKSLIKPERKHRWMNQD